jgi:RNA methyltransferase, TrmH family
MGMEIYEAPEPGQNVPPLAISPAIMCYYNSYFHWKARTMNYTKISSTSNLKIKELLNVKNRKDKTGNAPFVIEGPHLAEAALEAGISFGEVFFTEAFGRKGEGRGILKNISGRARKIYEVTDPVLRKVSDTERPQGIIAVVSFGQPLLEGLQLSENPLLIVSDGIQEPGNLGALIRTADAAAATAVIILPGSCDVFMPKTIRATAGSIFNLPIIHARADELLDWLRRRGIRLAVTAAGGGTSVFDAELTEAVALVFGNEARGLSEEIKLAADIALSIPIYGKAESLNVAAAAAVILYEAARQKRAEGKTGE